MHDIANQNHNESKMVMRESIRPVILVAIMIVAIVIRNVRRTKMIVTMMIATMIIVTIRKLQ